MKPIFETCETCQGTGMIKVDIFGETYPIDQRSVWNEEAQEYLELSEKVCPDCCGAGEVEVSEDKEDERIDEWIKNRKEL